MSSKRKIVGATVGTPIKPSKINSEIHRKLLSEEIPEGPALWFNTNYKKKDDNVAPLSLDEDETGYAVMATVDDETYGVKNMTMNQGATNVTYDFTVL